jgi:hypothetical protein
MAQSVIQCLFDFADNQDAAMSCFIEKRSKKCSLFLFANVFPMTPARLAF